MIPDVAIEPWCQKHSFDPRPWVGIRHWSITAFARGSNGGLIVMLAPLNHVCLLG